eukprot:1340637-Amphidinium_carterae.1
MWWFRAEASSELFRMLSDLHAAEVLAIDGFVLPMSEPVRSCGHVARHQRRLDDRCVCQYALRNSSLRVTKYIS